MTRQIKIGDRLVGDGQPCFIIAELGLNHNGDLQTALDLIDAARLAGADAIKLQKRFPMHCVPKDQWDKLKETPWGVIPYIDYREHIEFELDQYAQIAGHCHGKIPWSCSVWDIVSLHFMLQFNPPFIKIPSAMLTNDELLTATWDENRPTILSTGMSTMSEIDHAYHILHPTLTNNIPLAILHCTSTYPCADEELNLNCVEWLQARFPHIVIGFSNHSPGIIGCVVAATLGAKIIEAHITLDRAQAFGGDHAASLEPHGFARMVKYVRFVEQALGTGIKKVYDSELPVRAKLRGDK